MALRSLFSRVSSSLALPASLSPTSWSKLQAAVSSSFSTEASSEAQGRSNHIVVFGGRGFVGSHIIQEALNQGLHVVSVSRSGTPPAKSEPWMQQVEWVRGNALEPPSYERLLDGALAAISAVGAFGNQQQMLQSNGTANVTAIQTAAKAGVPRFVFISAHVPPIPGIEMVLRGYVDGKRMAEEALRQHYPNSGVALRPGAIYGNRVLSSHVTLPLQYIFKPQELLIERVPQSKQWSQLPLVGAVFTPPTDVQVVASTAVRAATDSSFPAGIVDIWQLSKVNPS